MNLTKGELEFLSAWAREEWEPACYQLPAHHLQLTHGVSGGHLIAFIKAWTDSEGKKDQDILAAAGNPHPPWPWATTEEFHARFQEASRRRPHREGQESRVRSRNHAGPNK
jgi:phage/plasmid-associated DNA primase